MAYVVGLRALDLPAIHPELDTSRTCAVCGRRVGLYPPAMRLLEENPSIRVVCRTDNLTYTPHAIDPIPVPDSPPQVQPVRFVPTTDQEKNEAEIARRIGHGI